MGKRLYNKSVNQSWTMKEQMYLHENYFKLPIEELAIKLQRSYGQIHAKASDLGINLNSMKKTKPFTTLKIIPVPSTPANKSEVVDKPKVTRQSCGKQKAWTKEDDDYIVEMYNFMSYSQIADKLQTTSQVLDHRIRKLKAEGRLTKRVSNKKVFVKKVLTKTSKKKAETLAKQVLEESRIVKPELVEPEIIVSKAYDIVEKAKKHAETLDKIYNKVEPYTGQVMVLKIDDLKVKDLTALSNILENLGINYEIK